MNVKRNPSGDFDVPTGEQSTPNPTPEAPPIDPAVIEAAAERYAEVYEGVIAVERTDGLAA